VSDSEFIVSPRDAGVRLDKFLAAPARVGSRARAIAALERGKVFVNGQEAGVSHASTRLGAGDKVRVWMDRPGSAKPRRASPQVGDLQVIYEDEALLVVNKPAGLLSVPLERKSDVPSVYDQIEDHLRSRGKRRPFVVHRIDQHTSGLVVFAKDDQRQLRLKALIQKQTHPRDPLAHEAISDYRTLETFRDASLIEVRLRTGRRNQIRIQARLRGHTLVGEDRYVYGPQTLRPINFERQALHAYLLAFQHPDDGRRLEFVAPPPPDFMSLLKRLRS
jgi:23S rRNA pseudouridine1911/1915/1917 synthase